MIDALTGLRPVLLVALTSFFMLSGPVKADKSAADARLKADEQEMLSNARKEADERRRSTRGLEGSVGSTVATDRKTVNIGTLPAAEQASEARRRDDELQRLSEKLRRAGQVRAAKGPVLAPAIETPWKTDVTVAPESERGTYRPEARAALGHKAPTEIAALSGADQQVAILMVMQPGKRGIRRFDKTADPILCTYEGCYISNGHGTPAQFVSLRRSFGFLNTFGPRAGACRHQTACVFRGVALSATNPVVQPVDLKMMVHDRREMKPVQPDDTCRVDGGRLSCARTVRGDDYDLWIVPESVARKAGTDALQRALDDGLSDGNRRAGLR